MRIGDIRQASSGSATSAGGGTVREAGESRALVALTPVAQAPTAPAGFRQAPFLAHLLAVKAQHAQTRERRRADPHEALAAYRATANLVR